MKTEPVIALVALVAVSLAACSSDAGGGTAAGGAAAQAGSAGASMSGAGGAAAGQAGSSAMGGSNGGAAGAATGGAAGAGGAAAGAVGMGGAAAGNAGMAGASMAGAGGSAPFELVSSAFKEGMEIPLKYKCAEVNPKGDNQSPPLSWGPGPAGTKSYAVVLMHLPTPEHWVIWDIPAAVTSLPENIEHQPQPAMPAGAKQSLVMLDGFTGSGYLGPCPQAVGSAQTYQFTLYALDVETLPGLSDTSTPTEAATVVKQHLVAGSKGVTLSGTQIRTN